MDNNIEELEIRNTGCSSMASTQFIFLIMIAFVSSEIYGIYEGNSVLKND